MTKPFLIPGLYMRDGELRIDMEEFRYLEWDYYVVENSGFTWCEEQGDNAFGVSWFACSEERHATYDDAQKEATEYMKLYPNFLVRISRKEHATASLILNAPK